MDRETGSRNAKMTRVSSKRRGIKMKQNTLYHCTADDRYYSKTCVKLPLSKRPKNGFQDQLSLNAGQNFCRMLQLEHSAILSTFTNLPVVNKIFVLSIFAWLFYTDLTVFANSALSQFIICNGTTV